MEIETNLTNDLEILYRVQACMKKAEQLCTKIEPPGNITSHEPKSVELKWAHALFKAGYKGKKLRTIEELAFLKTPEGYIQAGYPSFLGLFGRDSLITAWQLLDYNPLIAKHTLALLAKMQGTKNDEETGEQPGKILHEYYSDSTSNEWWNQYKSMFQWLQKGVPYYFSIDSTFLFCIVAAEYLRKTLDKQFKIAISQHLLNAMNWMSEYGIIDDYKFIRYKGKDEKTGLTNMGWKDSNNYQIKPPVAIVEVQGYAYATLQLAEVYGNKDKKRINKDKKAITEVFQDAFWMNDQQYYAFAVDGENKKVEEITSNPGHLLFTGILDHYHEKSVVKKLFSDELWTPYGIRTHSIHSDLFNPFSYHCGSVWPHDNWIIAQGLKKQGYIKEYNMVKQALYKAYDAIGYLPELYGVTIDDNIVQLPCCHPQAWASGALLNFILEDEKK